jgi:outer membrane protein
MTLRSSTVRARWCARRAIALCGGVALTLVAAAQAADPGESDPKLPLWEAGIGVGGLTLPAYKGSSTTRVYVAPLPYFVYRGEILRANRDGVGLKVLGAQNWKLDLSLSGELPVESSGTKREGMKDLPLVGEVGAVLKYDFFNSPSLQWQLRVPLRYATGIHLNGLQSVGWISDPGLWVTGDVSLLGARWDWGASASVNFQNEKFNSFYYGVGATDATPTRSRYFAGGGYSGADLRVGAIHRFGRFVASGFVGMSNISGATFANSPLVQQTTNFYTGVAVFWVLKKSNEVAALNNRGDMQ